MISARPSFAAEASTPTRRGPRPHGLVLGIALAALLAAGTVSACANTDANQVTPPVVLGMTPQLAPAYDDGQTQLFQVQVPVQLPIRQPQDGEVDGLPETEPYPREPWLKASDLRLEVRYTLSNLDDQPHDVLLLLDPWNEFVRYRPGLLVADVRTVPNYSGYMRQFRLEPKSRTLGILTNDDMTELAVDLATVEKILETPPAGEDANVVGLINRVFDIHNRSNTGDPLVTPYIPRVIAGLTGFDLGLRTAAPMTVAVEITIDITDRNGDRVIPQGASSERMEIPTEEISPPGARPLN
jgi:hypothetical protein